MRSSFILIINLIALIAVAPLAKEFSPGYHRVIIWGIGSLTALVIFLIESRYLSRIPTEYYLYLSLAGFAILGLPKVEYLDDFNRYLQVFMANFVLMVAIYLGIRDFSDFKRVTETLFYSILIIVGYSYIMEGSKDYSTEGFERLSGLLGNSNGTATYARTAILLGLCVMNWSKYQVKKWAILGIILFLAYVIILTASRSNFALLGFVIFAYIYLRYMSRLNIFVYFSTVVVVLGLFGTVLVSTLDDFYLYERLIRNEGKSFEEIQEGESRVELYAMVIEATIENPILGLGLNQFRHYSDGHISHTDFLDIASQLGLIAMMVYVSIYVKLYKGFRRILSLFKNDLIPRILLLLFITEILFGLSNPNWFLQLNMVILSLLISYQNIIKRTWQQKQAIWRHEKIQLD